MNTKYSKKILGQVDELPNVNYLPQQSDMSAVFGQTRILLVPSRWEEGFGGVAMEAASCGIPVVASRCGGLPEAVGDGGILIADYMNTEEWITAIEGLCSDEAFYNQLSKAASLYVQQEEFSADVNAARFLKLCELD